MVEIDSSSVARVQPWSKGKTIQDSLMSDNLEAPWGTGALPSRCIQALCQEKVREWKQSFGELGEARVSKVMLDGRTIKSWCPWTIATGKLICN